MADITCDKTTTPRTGASHTERRLLHVKLTTCIPSPYQTELFDSLADRDDVELRVLYWRDTTKHVFELKTETVHDSRVLSGLMVPLPVIGREKLSLGIVQEILSRDYDIFVVSGFGPTAMLAMLVLTALRKPWVFWGERPHPCKHGSWKERLRKVFWRVASRSARGVIGIGRLAVEQYERLGVPPTRLENVPYSPNVDLLLNPPKEYCDAAAHLRDALGADRDVLFLYCGQLTKRKAVDVLVKAFLECHAKCPASRLVILGGGPEEDNLRRAIPEELESRVTFAGVVQRPRLYHYYLAADVFAFPSRYDGWDVVINEAMAAGLPVITTDQVGAAADMVTEGQDGFLVPVDDSSAFAERMKRLADSRILVRDMGNAARNRANDFTASVGAMRMRNALETLLGPQGGR
ncbi:MAG: glycosyltransferase family 4 protein [Planctomycetes bacterium]|nr:glycosyltransferase family 4 protein [Planctomycetota bacterium]